MPMLARAKLLTAATLLLSACGSRTGLFDGVRLVADAAVLPVPDAAVPPKAHDAGSDADVPTSCASFPAIPPPVASAVGAACAFAAGSPTSTPVLATIAGNQLQLLKNVAGVGASMSVAFQFGLASIDISSQSIVSRGDFLGALVTGSSGTGTLSRELVLLRLDGTVLAHHADSMSTPLGSTSNAAVVGNAGGTFAFSVSGGAGSTIWEALPDGTLLGPFDDVQLYASPFPWGPMVDPDARGRLVVASSAPGAAGAPAWLDPCTGTQAPLTLTASAGWGSEALGITPLGQLEAETADGVTPIAYPPLGSMAQVFWFSPPAIVMLAVPPIATTNDDAHLVVVNAATSTGHALSLSYSGVTPVPADTSLGQTPTTANPDGFGVDSAGNVTMFLSDASGQTSLETTIDGQSWTPVGDPVPPGLPSEPQAFQLRYAEAGGTYLIQSQAGSDRVFQIARPSSGVVVPLGMSDFPGAPTEAANGYELMAVAHDGGCVSAIVSATEVDVFQATTGTRTRVTLAGGNGVATWGPTWIPGDDALLYVE
jgi:hypothetical protein